MSETTPENVQEASTEAEATSQGKPGETPEQTIAGLREALSKANSEAKANRLAAKELEQFKSAQMTELEKAQAAAKQHEEAATKAAAEALRWRVAAKHGISDEDAETFLTGSDEESLIRQAERLSVLAASKASPTTPKPDLTQGGKGTPAKGSTADQFAATVDGLFQH